MKLTKSCPYCDRDDWDEQPVFTTLNPNGEYVEGYGCVMVMIQTASEYFCRGCHYQLGKPVKRISYPETREGSKCTNSKA